MIPRIRGIARVVFIEKNTRAESIIHYILVATAFVLIAGVGIKSMDRPAFGDGQAYMIPNALHMMKTFNPFIEDEVHPPAYFMLEGLIFRIFGPRIAVAHLMVSLLALIGIAAVYLLGTSLGDRMTGAMAAVMVAAWPPYLVQSTLIRLDMPVAVFTVVTLLAAQRGWAWMYILTGSLAVLTKAPGVLMPGALVGISIFGWWRPRFPRIILWIPVLVFAVWLVACKIHFGWFFLPENIDDFSRKHTAAAIWRGFQYWIIRLLIDQRGFIPAAAALLCGCLKDIRCLIPIPLVVVIGLLIPSMTLEAGIAIGFYIGLCILCWRFGGIWISIPILGLLLIVLFSPYHYQFPRYLLPAWPGFALVYAAAFRRWNVGWFVAVSVSVFMAAAAFSSPDRGANPWSSHECTFETVEIVQCRFSAVEYLDSVYSDKSVITTPKAADDLSIPALGYVRNPIPVIKTTGNCQKLLKCGYYYELSTRSRKAEARIRRSLKRCGIRLVREHVCRWQSPLGSGHAAIYRLEHSKRDRRKRSGDMD